LKSTMYMGFWLVNKLNRTDCDVTQPHPSQNATVKNSHGSCPETMGVTGHDLYCRLWALDIGSNQRRALMGSWAPLPMTGSIEIERGDKIKHIIQPAEVTQKPWAPLATASTDACGPWALFPINSAH
jgi:hypothetical protein